MPDKKDKFVKQAMCEGKVRHESREAAMITIKKMRNPDLHPYVCPFCSTKKQEIWHIGHP